MNEDRKKELRKILKDKGIKITQPRVLMLDFLLTNRIHPTAECIYTRLSNSVQDISLATVYNNLHCFEKHSLVKRIRVHPDYDIYDITIQNHPHFLCRVCGEIFDVREEITIPGNLRGFKVEDYVINFIGICKSCQDNGSGFQEHD